MPTIKVVDLIAKVQSYLSESGTGTYWPRAELLDIFNEAQRAAVSLRPDSYSVITTFSCANDAKQTLTTGQLRLLDVFRNVSSGKPIRMIKRDRLDDLASDWYGESMPASGPSYAVFDASTPKVFWLYPKPSAAHSIEIAVSQVPAVITVADWSTDTQTITLDDVYEPALFAYMAARAKVKESDAASANAAQGLMQQFTMLMTGKAVADAAVTPVADGNKGAQMMGRSQ